MKTNTVKLIFMFLIPENQIKNEKRLSAKFKTKETRKSEN